MNASVLAEAAPSDAAAVRAEAIAAILEEQGESADRRSEVISWYGGEELWLYRYDVLDDVRLVFMPEAFLAADAPLTGEPPALDVAVLRAWRDGRRARHRLRQSWAKHAATFDPGG